MITNRKRLDTMEEAFYLWVDGGKLLTLLQKSLYSKYWKNISFRLWMYGGGSWITQKRNVCVKSISFMQRVNNIIMSEIMVLQGGGASFQSRYNQVLFWLLFLLKQIIALNRGVISELSKKVPPPQIYCCCEKS